MNTKFWMMKKKNLKNWKRLKAAGIIVLKHVNHVNHSNQTYHTNLTYEGVFFNSAKKTILSKKWGN